MTHAISRRALVKSGSRIAGSAITLSCLPRTLLGAPDIRDGLVETPNSPDVTSLIQYGLDVAHSSGAEFTDIRLTHGRVRRVRAAQEHAAMTDAESMTMGVRCLVRGYWGFASGAVWGRDAIAQLAKSAAHLARVNASGPPREITLAPTVPVANGHWTMPVEIDPFRVDRGEILDFFTGLLRYATRYSDWTDQGASVAFTVMDKTFGASDQRLWTQRTYLSGGSPLWVVHNTRTRGRIGVTIPQYTTAGKGWEMYTASPWRDWVDALHAEAAEDVAFPVKAVDVGRYDAVLDSDVMANVLTTSIGAATQLDRVLGYEANAGGTSYVTDPQQMLGVLSMGSPSLTVTANRSAKGGAASVQWDDEGITPDTFTLVDRGILHDLQTSRETAGELAKWSSASQPPHSHGCAFAPSALDLPLTHTPNLTMAPGTERLGIPELIQGIERGVFIKRSSVSMDFQQLNGYGRGAIYEINNGKRVAALAGAGFLFRAPNFWKSLSAVGGPESVMRYGMAMQKGEPPQQAWNSVDVVPGVVRDLSIIDTMRKS